MHLIHLKALLILAETQDQRRSYPSVFDAYENCVVPMTNCVSRPRLGGSWEGVRYRSLDWWFADFEMVLFPD